MRNVAGVQQSEAQKATDLYLKCQYLDEPTDGKGICFSTGTPISNSMTELYTVMRYLQSDQLKKHNLEYFDAWEANFRSLLLSLTSNGKRPIPRKSWRAERETLTAERDSLYQGVPCS